MSTESFLLVVRLGFSLSLVFGLMWVAARVLRSRAGTLGKARLDHLEVVERKPLGKGSSVAIVRVGDELLTIGITDSNVTLLGPANVTLDAEESATTTSPVTSRPTSAVVSRPVPPAAPATTTTPTGAVQMPALTADPASPATAPDDRPAGGRSILDTLRDRTVRHLPA